MKADKRNLMIVFLFILILLQSPCHCCCVHPGADVVLVELSCVFSCVAAFWRVAGSFWGFGRQPQEAETPAPALPTSASRIASSCRSVCYTWNHFHIHLGLHASLFSPLSVSICSSSSLDFFSYTMQNHFPFCPYLLVSFLFSWKSPLFL